MRQGALCNKSQLFWVVLLEVYVEVSRNEIFDKEILSNPANFTKQSNFQKWKYCIFIYNIPQDQYFDIREGCNVKGAAGDCSSKISRIKWFNNFIMLLLLLNGIICVNLLLQFENRHRMYKLRIIVKTI